MRNTKIAIFVGCGILAVTVALIVVRARTGYQQSRARRATSSDQKLIEVHTGEDLQAAISAARCGDKIALQAGATWDTPAASRAFVLPNKGCGAGNPITIESSAIASLPSGRVSPSNSSRMARIRALGGAGAFEFAPDSAYWVLDGLEITNQGKDSPDEMVNSLIDVNDQTVNHITIRRCYIHPKETGTDYTRSVLRAMVFNGSYLTFEWNYAAGFFGRLAAGDTGVNTNSVILCIAGNNLKIHDNFLQAWYVSIFTGGGGEDPQYTATLSGTVNTSQADFSSTTGLSVGQYVRFELQGSLRVDSINNTCGENIQGHSQDVCASATITGGTAPTSKDVDHTIWITPIGGGRTYRGRISTNSGPTVIFPYSGQAAIGNYTFRVFEVAKVTSISGSTVHYSPVGINYLTQAPTTPGLASWRTDQVVHDLNITGNTIDIDYDSAVYEHTKYDHVPKGWVELKAGGNILFEGNTFTGYTSTMGISQHSNEGSTPWTSVNDLTIRSNFFNPVRDGSGAARAWGQFALIDPYNSDQPGHNITITNNLILGSRYFFLSQGVEGFTVTHNTVINDQPSKSESATMIFGFSEDNYGLVLKDNIMLHNDSGVQCMVGAMSKCWPAYVMQNNLIVDNFNIGGLDSRYGTGILKPVKNGISSVGFVDISKDNYRLAATSPFKGKASDRTDPGVNMDVLQAALGNAR